MIFRKALAAGALAALLGGGMVVASTDTASARIVCNQWGHCWHQPGPFFHTGWGWHNRWGWHRWGWHNRWGWHAGWGWRGNDWRWRHHRFHHW